MLLDEFLPEYEVQASYRTRVKAPADTAYAAIRAMDMRDSPAVKALYALRGLPKGSLTLEGMLKWGFVLLADEPPQELVFGLTGRFWTHRPEIRRLDAEAFRLFDLPGYAKAAGNIRIEPADDGCVLVSTETRIHSTDTRSRRRFRMYWTLIGPFSGVIRREWLRLIRRQAEASSAASPGK